LVTWGQAVQVSVTETVAGVVRHGRVVDKYTLIVARCRVLRATITLFFVA